MMKKFQRKSAKKLKGMTLVECIVAMAVLAVAGLIMVKIGQTSQAQLVNSNHLINKTSVEAPIGNAKDTTTLNQYCTDTAVPNGEQEVTFSVGSYGNVTAKRYDTLAADSKTAKNCNTNMSNDACLQYYVMD